mmetsp:Transcript_7549/g.22369  ORF Transcript_7549/g.22369 Transcript_7549/m.22369 type:complete len:151 (+) Transcript_7549:160-612(+)|eukprot:CAMPEP_0119259724 /NCGR_PEP_ID=MMETSP1329-20130426/416_1 /TAXON_ID=114041 /ORGANISM="Genus nov. species nov., Strain RCC1024" /LENGTH=150 /DNA_ID=CAMNT_0007259123 /DNA_START=144 /DNA_END=596 /DNA_ORIENTATION=+
MSALRRVKKEFEQLAKSPLAFCPVEADEADQLHATARLQGPEGTPYAGGEWTLDLTFPNEYPFKAPNVVLKTEVLHPNVKTDTGEICPDVLFANWSPTLNVRTVLTKLHELMQQPAVEHPLETDLAVLYGEDKKKYDAKIKAHVKALKKK